MALHTRVLRLVLSGLMGALLVVSKQAMSGLPNLEPVSLLIILFALELPRETPGAITVFILLQARGVRGRARFRHSPRSR